jgi:hypothetical protein
MGFRVRDIAILGVFAVVAGVACGGRTSELILPGPIGAGDDDGGDAGGSSSSGVSSSSGSSSSSGIGSSSGTGSTSGGSSSGTFEDAASCSPNAEKQGFASPLASCWGCAVMGCAAQMNACTEDCACNAAIVNALGCVDAQRDNAFDCFMAAFGAGDPTTMSLVSCLATVNNECDCTGAPPTPDASTCVASSSASSGGSDECTSDFSETCDGSLYKVVCSCPQDECVCFGPSATSLVSIASCPLCPGLGGVSENDVLSACGFPN